MSIVTEQEPKRIDPQMFALWIGIATIIMLFAGFTSAFIVRSGADNFTRFSLPAVFWINTVVIALSSGTMAWAVYNYKKYNYSLYKVAMGLTLLLGIAFAFGQYKGWFALAAIGVFLDGHPSGAYIYVISFVHVLHVLGGLVAILVMWIRSLYKPFNPNKLVRVQMIATYWHFVDVLWIYLILFFQIKFF